MRNKLFTFLLGATALSSSMTGDALAARFNEGGVVVQSAPSMSVSQRFFSFNNTALMDRQIAHIVTAFDRQRSFNIFMENQRKALAGFNAKNEQIKDDELLARHLQSQYDSEFARQLQTQYDSELVYPLDEAEVEQEKIIAPVEKANPRSGLLSSIKDFNASGLKAVVKPVEKADPRSDLLSAIKDFNASSLKAVVKPVVERVKRRPLPKLPVTLKKIEEARTMSDLLAHQISGFAQDSTDEVLQTAKEAVVALRLAIEEGDIDSLENNGLQFIEGALKRDSSKLSWFVSEFYDENEGWDFGFFEEDEIMTEMKKSVQKEALLDNMPLSQQRAGSVKKLDLNADSGLSLLDQIRLARGVVEAEEDKGFVKPLVMSVPEEVEKKPVMIKRTPAKKGIVQSSDEANDSGMLLSAITGFNLKNLKKAKTNAPQVEEIEKVETLKSRLENALAGRRSAIADNSDHEDDSWDDF